MNINRRIIPFTIIAAVLALALYSGFWFWMAAQIGQEMDRFMMEAERENVRILPRVTGVGGYPGTPEARFAGRVATEEITAEIPMLTARSVFVTGKPLSIEAPEGVDIVDPPAMRIWSLDFLLAETVIPETLPTEPYREDLTAWRDSGGVITVGNIEFVKGPLRFKGSGEFKLDGEMQPAGTFNARITGHMDFLQWLQQHRYLETREALLTAAVLAGLSGTDPETGETVMNVSLTLQNRTLFVGPLRLAVFPPVEWEWRSQPALPR